jgi:hypothetical protein
VGPIYRAVSTSSGFFDNLGDWSNSRGDQDVDMVFTRRLDKCRLQVLLMNPNLVPQTINVVIGENLYKLKFHVELDPSGSNPQPMETDNEQGSGRGNPRMEAGDKGTRTG